MSKMFGRNLKMVLGKRGITQKRLAALIDSNTSTVSGYCNGVREPNCEMLAKIAIALNVSSDVLIGLTSRIAEYDGKISKAKSRKALFPINTKHLTTELKMQKKADMSRQCLEEEDILEKSTIRIS